MPTGRKARAHGVQPALPLLRRVQGVPEVPAARATARIALRRRTRRRDGGSDRATLYDRRAPSETRARRTPRRAHRAVRAGRRATAAAARRPAADHRAPAAGVQGLGVAEARPSARGDRREGVVPRLLLVTPAELTRDPRARRAAAAAQALGL